ncbi:MAG: hypothetical protein ACREFL_00485 [Stellaceae bacterium]
MLGDQGGFRSVLADHGITVTLNETPETLGNVTGGVKTGGIVEGRLTAALGIDLDKAADWPGGAHPCSVHQLLVVLYYPIS